MRRAVIFKVLFEKRKVMVLFFLVCTFLIIYTSIQTVFITSEQSAISSTPDFVFNGTVYQSQDGSYPFIGYNDIGDFTEVASEIAADQASCYGVVYRSLYNYYDELTSVGFFGAVYGVPDEFIANNVANYLYKGTLPREGKQEGIVGYYFAQRFGIGIGDVIPQAVTLNKEWTEEDTRNYTVCGILQEGVSEYFNGSVIISRETFELYNEAIPDNMLLGYYNQGDNYDTIFLEISEQREDFQVPEGRLNYKQKEYSGLKIIISISIVLLMSVFLLTAVISYLLKGITPKIGLMKATGISTKYIVSTFLIGIFGTYFLACMTGMLISIIAMNAMNQYVGNFYKFEVHTYQFSELAILLVVAEFLFVSVYVFVISYLKSKVVSPKEAMAKTV